MTDHWRNVSFFQNTSPFTLAKLVDAMLFDTLWTKPLRLDTTIGAYNVFYSSVAMHALPKKLGDNSYDWLVWVPTKDSGNCIFIFRGGPDFGSHRLTLDSAAFVITKPKLGYQIWPGLLTDAGDMTGTGNHVLYTGGGAGGAGGYTDQNYYVLGRALDNKIDMFYRNSAAGGGDTITANADSLQDLLLGFWGYSDPADESNGIYEKGTLWLMYGSKQIPVHLNPQFADVKSIPQQDGAGISFSPNPATRGWSVATIVWPEAENAEYSIYDVLGKVVARSPIRLLGGAEQQRIYFPPLPPGAYLFSIVGARHSASTRLALLKATD